MVMFTHWRYDITNLRCLELGTLGVNMFFVISGFLITRILLLARRKNELDNQSMLLTIKAFIIRRCLRIFPIYYLYVGILYFFGRSILKMDITQNIAYFLTYTSNFLFFFEQQWDGYISHTWSLSVEEQFYLVFPWIVLFIGRKYLPWSFLILFIVGTAYPILYYKPFIFIVTVSCLNAFSIGAFLAYLEIHKPVWSCKALKVIKILSITSFILLFILPFYGLGFPLYKRVFASFWTTGLIAFIINTNDKETKKTYFSMCANYILDSKIFQWVGRLSYGIYIYHVVTTHVYIEIYKLKIFPLPKPNELNKIWVFQLILVLAMASISFYFIERPINSRKELYPYHKSS